MNGVTVRVLIAGIFNGPDHHALKWAEVGEEIVVASGAYANSLREDGFVAFGNTKDERAALDAELARLQAEMDELDDAQSKYDAVKQEWDANTEEPGGPSSPEVAANIMAENVKKVFKGNRSTKKG